MKNTYSPRTCPPSATFTAFQSRLLGLALPVFPPGFLCKRPLMRDPNLSSVIWAVADLLRGDFKQSEYGKVILPFTVLRRLDWVLESTKADVLDEATVELYSLSKTPPGYPY